MKTFLSLLFVSCLVALSQAVYCDNPFFLPLYQQEHWNFVLLNGSQLNNLKDTICPEVEGVDSCCDALVLSKIADDWNHLLLAIRNVRTLLAVLNSAIEAFNNKIFEIENTVSQSVLLTDNEKQAINSFLERVRVAVNVLLPALLDNYDPCWSTILRYLAGLVCHGCDPDWRLYILFDPLDATKFYLHVAHEVCDTIVSQCYPFFRPFADFKIAFDTALTQFIIDLVDPAKRSQILSQLYHYNPPCNSVADCQDYVCNRWLRAFVILENWLEDSFTPDNGTKKREAFLEGVGADLNDALHIVRRAMPAASPMAPRDSSNIEPNSYTGTYNPFNTETRLDTKASTTGAASSLSVFWMFWL